MKTYTETQGDIDIVTKQIQDGDLRSMLKEAWTIPTDEIEAVLDQVVPQFNFENDVYTFHDTNSNLILTIK